MKALSATLLVTLASSLTFSNFHRSLPVLHQNPKTISLFSIENEPGNFVASIVCVKIEGVSMFYELSGGSVCGTQVFGTIEQINEIAGKISASLTDSNSFALIEISVGLINGETIIKSDMMIFAPNVLKFQDVRNYIKVDQTNLAIEVAIFDLEYLTLSSTFSVEAISEWPSNLKVFTSGLSLSLYFSEPFTSPLNENNEFSVSFKLRDNVTGLLSEIQNIRVEVTEALLPRDNNGSLTFIGIISIIILSIFLFALNPNNWSSTKKMQNEIEEKDEEIGNNVSESKEVSNEKDFAEIEKLNLSETTDSINESEIKDAVISRVSAIDIVRNMEDLSCE